MGNYDCDICKNVAVYGIEESIRRAKFPMSVDINSLNTDLTDGIKKLANSENGSGHDQFLTGIIVQFDLSFSNKAWVEAERYHFLDFVSSQSTMHRITRFDLDSSYNEYVDERIIKIMKEKVSEYNELCDASKNWSTHSLTDEEITEYKDNLKRKYLEILYSNPSGFVLTAGITTNYRQLKTIYLQRKDHRLPEWRTFCKWIEGLPCSELIVGK